MRTTTSHQNPIDEWVATALTDDDIVVELLLRLKHAGTVKSENQTANLPLLRWGFRQRRSRPSRLGVNVNVNVGGYLVKKETDRARASPMTPLCWSGGGSTSPSAVTADCFEDTSRQASCSTSTGSGSGSKAINEITSSLSRRSKKKKTFMELKDAEHLELKERLNLEKKIANVQATYDERSSKNQSLKRIKLEYSNRSKMTLISKSESRKRKRLPILPDLNMTPNEEDEMLYGAC